MIGQRTCFTRQIGKYSLRDFLSKVVITPHLTQRCGIDEIEMPSNQFSEVVFGAGRSKPLEQCGIV